MFGLDDKLASFSDGTTPLVVVVVAIGLGLRHASDPDHLAAVTTLVASGRESIGRRAAALGAAWGLGHATSLFACGLPIVLYRAYLPAPVREGAETTTGIVIVALAVWLLVRRRRGFFQDHDHPVRGARRPLQAYGIGLVHGLGGSAGVGVLLLSAIPSHTVAVVALGLFALCAAASMTALSTGLGVALASGPVRRSFHRMTPVLGLGSLAFGAWYALGALSLAPYAF
jgi:high-affinity nickel permease